LKKLSMADNGFLQVERPATPMHVGGVTVHQLPKGVDRIVFFQELLGSLRKWFSHTAPFNQRLQFAPLNVGVPSLVADPELDMQYHMRHTALPAPGTLDQLTTLISQLHSTHLDRSRPMWEFRLIEGVSGDRFALYFKIHHSCMDGMGAMDLMKSMMSDDPSIRTLSIPVARKKASRPKASMASRLENLTAMLRTQVQTGPELGTAFKDIALKLIGKDEAGAPVWYTAPQSPINLPLTGQRSFTVRPFALQDFKAIGKAKGATINDVMLACCGGALRRYFLSNNNLPNNPLIACVPVSIRPKEGGGDGNAITSLLCTLGTHIADPLERLRQVQQSSKAGKSQLNKMSKSTIEAYTMMLGMPFIAGQVMNMSRVVPLPFNMVISNVPASDKRLYLCGAEMESLFAVNLLFESQALNITVTSYVDTLDFSFLACRSVVPDLEVVADYMGDALAELCDALNIKRTKVVKAPVKAKVAAKTKASVKPVLKVAAKSTAKPAAKPTAKTKVKVAAAA
jgi:diacylglycerol O-acyltransferase